MKFIKKQTSTIGLDIGSSMVKAVKMVKMGDKYMMENFAIEPTEEGVFQSGEIKNPSSLAQSAREAVNKCDPNIKEVIVALPNYAILSDVLEMDLRPKKEMREAVMVEAERVSPFDMSEVEIDYSVLEQDEESKKMKVLMVAAKQEIILSYMDFLGEAGLKPAIVDVDLFSLANIFHINYESDKYKTCIVLNIGSENTYGAFMFNGVYHSARDISASGWSFRRELQLVPDITAEKINDILSGNVDPELDADAIAKALNVAGKEFANSIGVAVSYFQASGNIEKIDAIVLAGGYAWIPGLVNILELRTGAEVIVMDPFINVEYSEEIMAGIDPKKIGTILSVAMGLAARTY